jgi:hypothetical protein
VPSERGSRRLGSPLSFEVPVLRRNARSPDRQARPFHGQASLMSLASDVSINVTSNDRTIKTDVALVSSQNTFEYVIKCLFIIE